jgi:branched-chain amino acid transport system ATP-binding protein
LTLLKVERLDAFYGRLQALRGIDLEVRPGEIVGLVGANAAGKSTLMFSLAGLRTRVAGAISFDGNRIEAMPPHDRVARGLVLIPERRRLFPFMSVRENLELGAYLAGPRRRRTTSFTEVFELLPLLAERQTQVAGSLSGGEQQMVAIGRALMARPRLLLLDEPTEGLAPRYVALVFELVRRLRDSGLSILLVEQNVRHVLAAADRAYVLENGRVALEGPGPELLADARLKVAYLGL